LPRVERIIAATPEMAEAQSGPLEIDSLSVIGVANQQGASRLRSVRKQGFRFQCSGFRMD
jgi:hypothetical protein